MKIRTDDLFRRRANISGMPLATYGSHRLDKFKLRPGAEGAVQKCVDFVTGKLGHHFLTLFGEPGRGKTHLALGLGWFWLEQDVGLVKYWQLESLLDDLRSSFHAQTDETRYYFERLLRLTKEVSLLILDDLGVEQSTDWARAKLDEILDARYINGLYTVVTSNLLPSRLSPRIASRLKEGTVLLLKCGDYRQEIARSRELKEGKTE